MKKVIKRLFLITAAVLCLIFVSGCSLNFFSVESLLAPPALSGDNGEVQAAFNRLTASKTVQLRTPSRGTYKSSFVLYDIDGDSENEAVVFYTDTSIDSSARIAFLDCVNGTWVIASDIKGAGSGVYSIDFADFNGDGKFEVVVAWSTFENKTSRTVTVYTLSVGETGTVGLKTVLNEYYTACHIADFNNDGKDDFIVVYADDSGDTPKTYFRVFGVDGADNIVKYAETMLDGAVSSVSAIKSDSGVDSEGKFTRVFVDCIKNETSIFTEVICWDKKALKPKRIFSAPAVQTLRSSKIPTSDLDGDERLEVPATVSLDSEKQELEVKGTNTVYTVTGIRWLNAAGDNSESDIFSVYNPIHSYLFKMPWGDKVTVRYDIFKNSLVFYRWDAKKKSVSDELFRITSAAEGDSAVAEGMTEFYSDASYKYYYSITEKGTAFGITEDTVTSSFIKL